MLLQVLRQAQSPRKADRRRITADRCGINLRPARVGKSEKPGNLVEGLARGIVDRLPEQFDVVDEVANQQQARVPAGHEQSDCR